jgi:hypothetical protein
MNQALTNHLTNEKYKPPIEASDKNGEKPMKEEIKSLRERIMNEA